MSRPLQTGLRGMIALLLRVAVGFYFRRIECFHLERIPVRGPVLFASNHPNSVADAFILGTSVGRPVHFVATVQLFRFRPFAWLLRQCGIIPVNRVKDDPRGMRSVRETFEACFGVLEVGGAVGIFPEGITYEDSQLKEIKSGAARMALELEEKHSGRLGLVIVPIGLTYSAKERYRSEVLVHAGEPIRVAEHLPRLPEERRERIRQLSFELERRLKALIVTLPDLELGRVVDAVRRLYLEELRLANTVVREPVPRGAETLLLLQSVAETVEAVRREEPERYTRFVRRLEAYDRRLDRMRTSDEILGELASPKRAVLVLLKDLLLGAILLPLAIHGWVHRLIPVWLIREAERRYTLPATRKAQVSSAAIVAGLLVFTSFYGFCVLLFSRFFGWQPAIWYALSLPVAGLVAHYYWQHGLRFLRAMRSAARLARAPFAARRLIALRNGLRAEIESARQRYRPLEPDSSARANCTT